MAATVHNNISGISKTYFESGLKMEVQTVCDYIVDAALKVKNFHPHVIQTIFVMPPSLVELTYRVRN
jgi:guanylate kinase